nr:uncharacterized protein K02A2.6-like [Onthophagus taurus]
MVTYVSKFIPNLSQTTHNLRQLLKKNIIWYWTRVHDEEFNKLKNLLVTEPVLAYFDEKELITLSVDSSKSGMGAVILQKEQPISPQRYDKIKEGTQKDTELIELLKIIKEGWPEQKKAVNILVKPYWSVRAEITEIKRILYKGDQVIIPSCLRKEILNKLHYGHMGINKTILKARQLIYWPNINNQIIDVIKKCYTCEKFQNSNMKETIINRELPSRPWEILAADFLHFDGKEYLIIVDAFSKFPEIICLQNNTTSQNVIKNFKAILARNGIPDILYTDNGPQFVNQQFQTFLQEWEIRHITTSTPNYPQSNGLIERHIQTIKKLMKKAKEEGNDMYLVILEYRATPLDKSVPSPAEILFNRKIKTLIPISENLLNNNPKNELYKNHYRNTQIIQNTFYNKKSKDLYHLKKGERVVVQQKDKTWKPGRIVEVDKNRPRSYKITYDGKADVYDRNRKFLKQFKDNKPYIDREVYDNVFEHYYNLNKPLITNNNNPVINNNDVSETPDLSLPKSTNNTQSESRPVRIRKTPTYLSDYVK